MDIKLDSKDGVYRIKPWKLFAHKYGLFITCLLLYPTIIGGLCLLMSGESYLRIGVVCIVALVVVSIVIGELRELFVIKVVMESHHDNDGGAEIKKALRDVGLDQ